MGTLLVLAIVILLVLLCMRSLIREHKSGALCECTNDCSTCKIQCQKNPAYYGIQKK